MNQRITLDDDLDSRREVWHLLHRLPPQARVLFLVDAAARCRADAAGRLPAPLVWKMQTTLDQARRCDRADERLTNEIYADLIVMWGNWNLDAMETTLRLVEWVRHPELRAVPPRPGAPSTSSSSSRSGRARTPCSTGSGRPRSTAGRRTC
jgi:hypothetical protein